MKLSVNQIMNLYGAIARMDGEFRFDPKVRFSLTMNLLAIERIGKAYELARSEMASRIINENGAEMSGLMITKEDAALRAIEHDVELQQITKDDLKLDTNAKLSPIIIAGLAPIISDL